MTKSSAGERAASSGGPGWVPKLGFRGLAAVLGAVLGLACLLPAPATGAQVLSGHVPAAVARLQPVDRLPGTVRMRLTFGLPLHNQAELRTLLEDIYNPASPSYRQYLTPEQFTERFGPTEGDYQTLIEFAQAHGLTVAARHPNRTLLEVTAPVADIEKSLHVTLRTYQHPTEARTFHAPDVEPSLDLAVPVLSIDGLDNFSRPRPLLHQQPLSQANDVRVNFGSGPSGTYMGKDFRAAYAPGVSNLTGSGQVVGLFQLDGYYASDITAYEAQAGLPNVTLTNRLLNGVSGLPGYSGIANAVGEVSLDIEMSIAMAPGLAKVMVYEGSSPNTILSTMATDNQAKQISCSWAWTGTASARSQMEIYLQQFAAQGQSFYCASGDSDAYTGTISYMPTDDPYITIVGGTTLTTTGPEGAWVSETVWNWGLLGSNWEGSSGGISTRYSIPTWQKGITMTTNLGSTTFRNIPDVSMTGDNVYVIYNNGSLGSFGGTSCAAPLWAGFTALINQQAVASGRTTVGFINPAIYTFCKGTNYSAIIHDVTTGNNTNSTSANKFFAVPGYDLCTGWGTPTGSNLINSIVSYAPPTITQQPQATNLCSGGKATFTVAAWGWDVLSYKWQKNSANLTDGGHYSGSTTTSLTISNANSADIASYRCVLTNVVGSVTSSVATLTLNDTQPPVVTVSSNIIASADQGQCSKSNVTFTASANDNCAVTNLACTPASGSTFAKGVTTVSCIAKDSSGNSATNSFTVTVNDTQPPVVTCPTNMVASTDAGQCSKSNVIFTATANDNCAVTNLTCTPASGSTFAKGVTTVACISKDSSGNSATNSFTVMVNDTQPPVVTCPTNMVASTDAGQCSKSNVIFTTSANDNCAVTNLTCTPASGSTFAKGVTTVACIAKDSSGNSATNSFLVTINDTQPPVVTCPTNMVASTDAGQCFKSNVIFTATATDNCSVTNLTCTPVSGSTFAKGVTIVACIAKDSSGNSATKSFLVTINDTEPPVVTCPTNMVTSADSGQCFKSNVIFSATATDNCSITNLACAPPSGSSFAVGLTMVNCTAADASGNTGQCGFTVTVMLAELPVINWPSNLAFATDVGQCSKSNVTYTATATDGCGVLAALCAPPSGSEFAVGMATVNCATTNALGHSAQCAFTVTVIDGEKPQVICSSDLFLSADTGQCSRSNVLFTFSATDNCVLTNASCTPPSGASFNVGETLVNCIATDSIGNSNHCHFTVTVTDGESPLVVCSSNRFFATDAGQCFKSNVTFTATATDNCTITNLVCTPPSGSSFVVGPTTVKCMAADASGNTAQCAFTVTVTDEENPLVMCSSNLFLSADAGQCSRRNVTFAFTAADNCAVTNEVCTPPSGSSFDVGETLVTCTAYDASGHTNSCQFIVTVADGEDPQVTCSSNLFFTIAPDLWAQSNVIYSFGATDNCTLTNVACAPPSGSLFALGTNLVTCTALDASSNIASCIFSVVVLSELLAATNETVNLLISGGFTNILVRSLDLSTPIEAITSVRVSLNVSGGFNGDLYAYLIHDSGRAILLNRVGKTLANPSGYDDAGLNLTFDDSAASGDIHEYRMTLFSDPNAPLAGPLTNAWAPDGRDVDPALVLDSDSRTATLEVFTGLNPNGLWTLFIADLAATNFSTLVAWGLKVTGTNAPPAITAQPQSRTNFAGMEAVLSVSATGLSALSYQWFFGPALIPDATNTVFTIPHADAINAGDYTVRVTSQGGSVTSTVASLTIQALQARGQVELEAYAGLARDGAGTRTAAFKATDTNGTVLANWDLPLSFTNRVADYLLDNVPWATAHLSAKTAWNLRQRLSVTFLTGQASVNFLGEHALPAGGVDDANTVDLPEYLRLAAAWSSPDVACDLDGSGWVDLDDYFLLANHWLQTGDPE